MNRDLMLRRALRGTAVSIAVAAVVDPAITISRRTKPEIVVQVSDTARDATVANRVARTLGKQYTVVREPLAGAAATVLVGDQLPHGEIGIPVIAVVPDTTEPRVSIERLDVPMTASADSRIPVGALVRMSHIGGRTVNVTLTVNGAAVDHATTTATTPNETARVPLTFIPTASGATPIRVTASLDDDSPVATADAAVDVRERKWPVLFYDPRPSWMSTFVRRAIERDTRFVVTSRIVTSKNVSSEAGRPPTRLDDVSAISRYDAIVVGAPDALSSRDVAGLDVFLRRRGGGVMLLLDQRKPGPYDQLTDVTRWGTNTGNAIVPIGATSADSSVRASELTWPTMLPAGARSIAGGGHPVIWQSPVGAGRLVVSGALDAWRFRDSSFDRFWQSLLAETANASPAPLTLATTGAVVTPGEEIAIHTVLRDVALGGLSRTRANISTSMDSVGKVRLYPAAVGEAVGAVRAPDAPGTYHIAISEDGNRTEIPVVVAANVQRASPAGVLEPWVQSRGGSTILVSQLDRLTEVVAAIVHSTPRLETTHPMRSAWWMLPFILALSGEWWLRRRRGLP